MTSKSSAGLLRSALYVPAINTRAIEKSGTLNNDVVIFDLEDSVAPASKQTARDNLISAYSNGISDRGTTVIRSNSIASADYLSDLETIGKCQPIAVLLPKVSTVADVELFERDAISKGLSDKIQCWFMIETASGIVNLADIISAGVQSRFALSCLVVGHNDLAKETGVSLTDDRRYLIPWLMQIILQAKNCHLQVLDSVWNNFKDTDGFNAECSQAKQMGFSGKTLIHPSQVEKTNLIFSPGEDEIAEAKAIVTAFQLPENSQSGVINLDGKMVERLHLQQAQLLLENFEQRS